MNSPAEATNRLLAWGEGDEQALEQLLPLVYWELYRLAFATWPESVPLNALQSSGWSMRLTSG
jgi:hypothetical protein